MTTRDKTRDKLLNSMRKTKEVIGEQPDAKQAHAETYAPPPAKSAPAEQVTELPSLRPVLASDPYQSHGRVWPD